MPVMPRSACGYPGCPHARPCPLHGKRSAHARGYDRTWKRLRLMLLRREPYCRTCGAPATDVDHVLPRARGGLDELPNLQPLCHACHARKTRDEQIEERG